MISSRAKPVRLIPKDVPEPYEHPIGSGDEMPLVKRTQLLVDGIASRLQALQKEVDAVELELENAQKLLVDVSAVARRLGGIDD